MFAARQHVARYVTPAVTGGVALYLLWRSIDIDTTTAHRAYIISALLLGCATEQTIRRVRQDIRDQVTRGLTDLRRAVDALHHDGTYQRAASGLLELMDEVDAERRRAALRVADPPDERRPDGLG